MSHPVKIAESRHISKDGSIRLNNSIQWAFNTTSAFIEIMGVDHCGHDIST